MYHENTHHSLEKETKKDNKFIDQEGDGGTKIIFITKNEINVRINENITKDIDIIFDKHQEKILNFGKDKNNRRYNKHRLCECITNYKEKENKIPESVSNFITETVADVKSVSIE